MKMKNNLIALITMLSLFILTGCADSVDVQGCLPPENHVYGFWAGTWHGMIIWFSFIGSLFDSDIAIYATNNNGGWYNFGFCGGFGLMIRLIIAIIKG